MFSADSASFEELWMEAERLRNTLSLYPDGCITLMRRGGLLEIKLFQYGNLFPIFDEATDNRDCFTSSREAALALLLKFRNKIAGQKSDLLRQKQRLEQEIADINAKLESLY